MYRISIAPKAKNQLKIVRQNYRTALALVLEELRDDPFVGKSLTRELVGKYSLRVGVYRIIYKVNIQNNTVQIITTGHRSIVYN